MAYTLLQQTIYAWFHQIPKEEAAIFALVVFFLIGVANLVITCRTKAWFMLTVAFTAALEVAGYAFRITMLHKPAYGPFVAMQALLIIPPIFLALVDYSAVGKLMRLAGGGGRLNPAWVSCSAHLLFYGILHLCRQYASPSLLLFTEHSAQALLSAKVDSCQLLSTKTICVSVHQQQTRMCPSTDGMVFAASILLSILVFSVCNMACCAGSLLAPLDPQDIAKHQDHDCTMITLSMYVLQSSVATATGGQVLLCQRHPVPGHPRRWCWIVIQYERRRSELS